MEDVDDRVVTREQKGKEEGSGERDDLAIASYLVVIPLHISMAKQQTKKCQAQLSVRAALACNSPRPYEARRYFLRQNHLDR